MQLELKKMSSIFAFLLFGITAISQGETDANSQDFWSSASTATANHASSSDEKINVHWNGHTSSLREIAGAWAGGEKEFALPEMGKMKDPRIARFLYRVAIVDPTLYRGRKPVDELESEHAIQYLGLMKTPEAAHALSLILKAQINSLNETQKEDVRNQAAGELMNFKGIDLKEALEVLNRNALQGRVLCPFAKPSKDSNGKWTPIEVGPEANAMIRGWLDSKDLFVRLQAGVCAAQGGIEDTKTFDLAKEQTVKPNSILKKGARNEKFWASQILFWLFTHGHQEAKPLLTQLQSEGY